MKAVPSGLCKECNGAHIAHHSGVCDRCLAKRNGRVATSALRARIAVGYGGICQCCGETEHRFLDLDHVFDDGKANRHKHGSSYNEWHWLLRRGCPRDRHQLLCSNCNQGKRRNRGVCPHIGKPGYPVAGARFPKAAQNPLDQQHPTS